MKNYTITIEKGNGYPSEIVGEFSNYKVIYNNNLWSTHATIEEAESEAKHLDDYINDIESPKPSFVISGKKCNGFTQKSAEIEINKIRKNYPDYILEVKETREGRYIIKATLKKKAG